jgi:hypothetical protein
MATKPGKLLSVVKCLREGVLGQAFVWAPDNHIGWAGRIQPAGWPISARTTIGSNNFHAEILHFGHILLWLRLQTGVYICGALCLSMRRQLENLCNLILLII